MIQINRKECVRCGLCADSCAFGALTMADDGYPTVSESCVHCNACAEACPSGALTVAAEKKSNACQDVSAYRDVWVVAETDPVTHALNKVTLELLSKGRTIADALGQSLGTVLLCSETPQNFASAVGSVGCDYAFVVRDARLKDYQTELYAAQISALCRNLRPAVVFMAASETGRDLAPRVSAMLQTGLTADCTGFDVDEKHNLVQIRPTYGGNIMASIITPDHRPQMASVRPNVFPVTRLEKPRQPQVTEMGLQCDIGALSSRLIKIMDNPSPFRNVTESEVVIVAGYGVGSRENMQIIQRLALAMGAALGATRKVVDEGWAPYEIQVGQTGKTVAPELYIGFGVSGALQHTIGIRNAQNIIAVNNDPAAPIFAMADTAILGDCVEVARQMLEQVEARRSHM